MSGVPSWASTELSRQTTIEWMMLWGCSTTLTCSGARSNSQRASITSSALFIIVAESTEILRPITQFGWAQASSGVTLCSVAGSRLRNGPPEAVSTMWSMRRAQAVRSSGRHWKIAECSLSIGSSSPPPCCTACMNNRPPTTSASLLASIRRLPARAAAMQGGKPAAPTMAAITLSTSGCAASAHSAGAPCSTSVRRPAPTRVAASSLRSQSACSDVPTAANRGAQRRHSTASSATRCWDVRANTS